MPAIPPRVVVVGGGLAGLVAAESLQAAGTPGTAYRPGVILVEAKLSGMLPVASATATR